MIKAYVECINLWTGKDDIFLLSQNPASIDYMKKYRKLVGFFKTDPLHSDLRMITPLFGSVFHCGNIVINYETNNASWSIQKESDFCNLVAIYVEQARLSNEIDNL
jgi:hypothetical protein